MTGEQRAGAEEVVAELRALAEALLDRLDPWLSAGAGPDGGTAGAAACGWCPLCALAAALRGERPELARRLAEQGAGWIGVVRALLDSHDQSCPATSAAEPAPGAKVQRIAVRDTGLFG